MGFSYRKSFKAGPIRVTASKSGISYSAGVKGARITKRANGKVTTRLTAPGTGLSYTTSSAGRPTRRPVQASQAAQSNSRPLAGQRVAIVPEQPPAGMKPLVFKAYLGTVTLHPDRIDITRTFMGKINGNRSTSTPWKQVIAVDFLEPTRMINGHIHFVTATDPRGLTATGGGNRMAAAARNPRSIMFTWQQRSRYEQLRNLLVSAALPTPVRANARPRSVPAAAPQSVADELAKLAQLVQQGVLSPAEFATAKARLLSQ